MAAYLGSRLNWKEHGKDWNVADTTQCQSWLSGRFKWMNHQTGQATSNWVSAVKPLPGPPLRPSLGRHSTRSTLIEQLWKSCKSSKKWMKFNQKINAPYCGNFWNCMKWRWCVSEIMIRNEPISCVSKILHRKLAVEIVVHWQHWCKTPRWKRFHRVSSQPDDHHSLWPLRPFVGEGAVQLTSFLL